MILDLNKESFMIQDLNKDKLFFCSVFQSPILEKQSLLLIMNFIISNCISNSLMIDDS